MKVWKKIIEIFFLSKKYIYLWHRNQYNISHSAHRNHSSICISVTFSSLSTRHISCFLFWNFLWHNHPDLTDCCQRSVLHFHYEYQYKVWIPFLFLCHFFRIKFILTGYIMIISIADRFYSYQKEWLLWKRQESFYSLRCL